MPETLLERLQREAQEYAHQHGNMLFGSNLNTLIAHVLKEASGELEGLKKKLGGEPLEDWEEDIGYNQAIDDAQRVLLGGDKG